MRLISLLIVMICSSFAITINDETSFNIAEYIVTNEVYSPTPDGPPYFKTSQGYKKVRKYSFKELNMNELFLTCSKLELIIHKASKNSIIEQNENIISSNCYPFKFFNMKLEPIEKVIYIFQNTGSFKEDHLASIVVYINNQKLPYSKLIKFIVSKLGLPTDYGDQYSSVNWLNKNYLSELVGSISIDTMDPFTRIDTLSQNQYILSFYINSHFY